MATDRELVKPSNRDMAQFEVTPINSHIHIESKGYV